MTLQLSSPFQPFLIHVQLFFKKRLSPIKPGDPIDYKDVDLLKKFITERARSCLVVSPA